MILWLLCLPPPAPPRGRLRSVGFRGVLNRNSLPAVLPLFLYAGFLPVPAAGGEPPAERLPFDLLVVNARIVDGTGNPWYRGEVGIRGARIAAIGKPRLAAGRDAKRVLDVS